MPKISLCAIMRNEEKVLKQFLSPLREFVDEIIMVDTGSTDASVKIAQSLGATVYGFNWIDDFSAARNYGLQFATGDWILWLDCDDVLSDPSRIPGIIDTAVAKNPDVNSIVIPYHYGRDKYGNITTLLLRERIVRNTGKWRWHQPVHEYLHPDDDLVIAERSDEIYVAHHHSQVAGNRTKDRNLKILNKMLEDQGGYVNTKDTRLLAYLFEENRANGNMQEALIAAQHYLAISKDDQERYQIQMKTATILRDYGGDKREMLIHVQNAAMTRPDWPDHKLFLANYHFGTGEYLKAIWYADDVLRIGQPITRLIINPLDYSFAPHYIKAKCYLAMDDLKNALDCMNAALAVCHVDAVAEEREALAAKCRGADIIASVLKVGSIIPQEKIPNLLDCLPDAVLVTEPIQDVIWNLQSKLIYREDNPKPHIDWFAAGMESWDGNSIDKGGIGGSETAVIHMAEALAAHNYEVVVYGLAPTVKVINGVTWTHQRHFDPKQSRYALISSRISEIFTQVDNCANRVLYCHDINMGQRLEDPSINDNIDCFLFVSEYQKEHYRALYPWIPEHKCHVFHNGIDVAQVGQESHQKRDPYRFIWSSSPDRGLETVLQLFPVIRNKHPEASLHIYYGFDNIDKVDDPGLNAMKQRCLELARQPRVYLHGRVPQGVLHEEMLKSSIWLYPSLFQETWAITATECLATGVYPIVSNIGALSENLDGCGTLIDGSPAYDEVLRAFLDSVDMAIAMPARERRKWEKKAQEYARTKDWKSRTNDFIKKIVLGGA